MSETPRHLPEPLDRAQLAVTLRAIADGFESGDTLEGMISFTVNTDDEDVSLWDVIATYRVGNLRGQGFTRMIGQFVSEKAGGAAPKTSAKYRVTLIKSRLFMTVADEASVQVVRTFIAHDRPLLAAAEDALAQYGYRRTGDWEHLAADGWTAEAERQ